MWIQENKQKGIPVKLENCIKQKANKSDDKTARI